MARGTESGREAGNQPVGVPARAFARCAIALAAVAAALSVVAAPAHAQTTTQVPASPSSGAEMVGVPGCHFGEKIDGTTADDIHRILTEAGYSAISGLKKSCDNNWHGQATMNGVMTNVMITPDGRIVQEGS